MQITLYNTCPIEYEKKFIKILKKVIRPALKQGKAVRVDEIKERICHNFKGTCHKINDNRSYPVKRRHKKGCSGCIKKINTFIEHESDTTMKIKIS